MKKGNYIDIYVIMASVSHKRKVNNSLQEITHLIEKACADLDPINRENVIRERHLSPEEHVIC